MTSHALPTRTLGRTGITAPALGIGCWAIGGPDHNLGLPMGWSTGADEGAAIAGLETSWELGARLYDTADVYGHGLSERRLGRLVAQVPREQIVLSSKVGYFTGTAEHGFDPRHMRRQLAQTLDNLGTDHLDIYGLHHHDFGPDDQWLQPAINAMHAFKNEGIIRAISLRGPHRFAPDRLSTPPALRGNKTARFRALFDLVQPDILAVRDNLLTPAASSEGIFSFADQRNCGVLITKPLGQGLLTRSHSPDQPPAFGEGDHRTRKRWFTAPALAVLDDALAEIQQTIAPEHEDLIALALWSCLNRTTNAIVIAGFTHPGQVRANITATSRVPTDEQLSQARTILAEAQAHLDDEGQVFLDG
ncbi:aldo/keto reductase [Streptomyces sp. NPDC051572]|uniref:aldo/keto reductase n=1 Tax=Streptomyces sp. NPDC051572 TaxID=3155802 RepID=UPI00344F519D